MLDAWMDLPAWLRIIVALIVVAIGGLLCWFISFRLGVLPLALGVAMLFFGGKSDSEKKGYHF
jgi:hypothetical protein